MKISRGQVKLFIEQHKGLEPKIAVQEDVSSDDASIIDTNDDETDDDDDDYLVEKPKKGSDVETDQKEDFEVKEYVHVHHDVNINMLLHQIIDKLDKLDNKVNELFTEEEEVPVHHEKTVSKKEAIKQIQHEKEEAHEQVLNFNHKLKQIQGSGPYERFNLGNFGWR